MDRVLTDAEGLAAADRVVVLAPAGCGKTHLIASALSHAPPCQLILTHTNAGTQVLRERFARLGVTDRRPEVDTIASFALRFANAYPQLAHVSIRQPRTTPEWRAVYKGAAEVLRLPIGRRVVAASYQGIFVDEYQDCSLPQHDFILALAETLPCRVLGDPLQAVFDFTSEPTVTWKTHVEAEFRPFAIDPVPWRWQSKNPKLGAWLLRVREAIQSGTPIDLSRGEARWRKTQQSDRAGDVARKTCFEFKRSEGTVVAIHGWAQQCHKLAGQLGGAFTSIEPIDAPDLFAHAAHIHRTRGDRRVLALIAFVKICATRVATELGTIAAAFEKGRAKQCAAKKHGAVLRALLAVAESDDLSSLLTAIRAMVEIPGVVVNRRELLGAMEAAIREFDLSVHSDLAASAWAVRQRTSLLGRTPYRRIVARTLLVKGLEYDHAIVLQPTGLSPQHLYVALTRGARSLTVLNDDAILHTSTSSTSA